MYLFGIHNHQVKCVQGVCAGDREEGWGDEGVRRKGWHCEHCIEALSIILKLRCPQITGARNRQCTLCRTALGLLVRDSELLVSSLIAENGRKIVRDTNSICNGRELDEA